MNTIHKRLLKDGKDAIFIQDHQGLKNIYAQTLNRDYQLHIGDLFLKLFYYACKHNRKSTILFLFRMYFEIFTDGEKLALRQAFYYGKVKIKEKETKKWYNDNILPVIKIK
jgi:hypothetical protein